MSIYVIRLRVTYFMLHYILVHVMSLVYRGLRTLHYMDLPSAGRRLKPNFSGVIALIFQLILSQTQFLGVTKQKKLIRT